MGEIYMTKNRLVLVVAILWGVTMSYGQTTDTDGDTVLDTVDRDDDNDGILDTAECPAQYATYDSSVISGTTGPVETITGIDLPSLNTSATLTVTEDGGDLIDLAIGSPPIGVFNGAEHTPMPNTTVESISIRADNQNTAGNDVDFVLTFDRPIFEIIFQFRSVERSNYQFTGTQHTEELVSSNGLMTYVAGTRTLDNTNNPVPPEFGGSGSLRITATSPTGMTQIEWSFVDNPINPNTADISLITFSAECDFDGDNIVNRLDLDSDNDGIYDVVEAGGVDADNNGTHDDNDDNANNTATNGIPSDANFGTGINNPIDTLADGSDDFVNLDSDNDGCSDANEAYDSATADGGDTGVFGVDPASATTIVNASGVVTAALPYAAPADSDTNTTLDFREDGPDSDSDGIVDACDLFLNDVDGDGVGDSVDRDDDNDGILDITENTLSIDPLTDADGDGVPVYLDDDDSVATGAGIGNANGIVEPAFDADGDNVPNHFDLDSDNDGIPDNVEAQSTGGYIAPAATTPAEFVTNNGINIAYLAGPGLTPVNSDDPADTTPDYWDTDSDNDSVLDIVENGDTDNSIVVFADADGDGIDDLFDTVDNSVVWDVNDAVTAGTIADLQTVYGDFDNDAAPTPVVLTSDLSFRDNCQINAGVIAADQTICEGDDPVAFTETTAASIDFGAISYQWQSSTTNATTGFTNITGANGNTFDSPSLTQDTWFKRIDTNTLNGVSCVVETNVIAVTVNNITAGVIAADQTLCEGDDPVAFTETTGTVADGGISYQWQSSTVGATGPFANIAGAINPVYDSPVLTQDTWFRRVDTSLLNTVSCTAITNVIAVTVNNFTIGAIAGDQTLCEGDDPVAFTETAATVADGTLTFQWQSSTTNATTGFIDIAGATSNTYDSPALTQDTWFRRVDTNTLNGIPCVTETNVVAVTINNITAGTITADQTFCVGGDPLAFTETGGAVADGSISYQWQSSTAGPTGPFTDIAGATGATYDSPALTEDTWFQRVDTSTLNTVACSVETNVIEVQINTIVAGVIAADQSVIAGGDPAAFTETTPTIADGVLTYQWQVSTVSATGPFTDIPGATNAIYDSPVITVDSWFRRIDTSTLNGVVCTEITNVLRIIIDSDGDDVPDAIDMDDDNDGITDIEEQNGDPALDTDNDGLVDRVDIDADGDGVNDVAEAGHGQIDMDGDGRLEGPFGNDGVPDVVQDDPDSGLVNYTLQDTDNDTTDDFQDIDDDGDNVATIDENPNPDGDGNPDTGETQDTDLDGIYDYLDIDDDGDGIYTVFEDYDNDNNPLNEDTDGDGVPDFIDVDDDGDGVFTQFEGVNADGDGNPNTGELMDTDCEIDNNCDNTPDYLDNDDDGDGLLTQDEDPDLNGDGDPEDAVDTDGNGTPDYLQPNDSTVPEGEDGITVFTGMSPNGDGLNDVFIIQGIQGLQNRVEIFNRWGGKVFESDNYGRNDNFFRGMASSGITVKENDQLPVGTYFYVLEYVLETGEQKSRAGYLYINR